MRYLILAAALFLPVLLIQAQGPPEKKDAPPMPPWATVTVGGEIRDLLPLRSKLNVHVLLDRDFPSAALAAQWHGPLPHGKAPTGTAHVRSMQVADAAWVVVLLDATDPQQEKFLPTLKAAEKEPVPVVMTGIIAAAKDKTPFVMHANACGKLAVVDPAGDKERPGKGQIRVVGQALPGKYEISKGKFTSLAIENGSSPILVLGRALAGNEKLTGKCRVQGGLRVQKGGPLVIDAIAVRPLDP